jgi:hypothetical protein
MVLRPFVGRSHQPVLAVEGGLHRRALKGCHVTIADPDAPVMVMSYP